MTLYVARTHTRQPRPVGAHRKPTRWDQMKGWLRSPHSKQGLR